MEVNRTTLCFTSTLQTKKDRAFLVVFEIQTEIIYLPTEEMYMLRIPSRVLFRVYLQSAKVTPRKDGTWGRISDDPA